MRYFFLVLFVLTAAGCGGQYRQTSVNLQNPDSLPQKMVLEDCLPESAVKVGDSLLFRFTEFPGRGYSWMLSEPDSVLQFLKLVSVDRVQLADLDGSPDRVEFLFTATRAGRQSLRFIYIRPWETHKPPHDSCVVSVTVRK